MLSLKWATKMQAIAQAGLLYTQSEFDKERYQQLLQLSTEMMAEISRNTPDEIATHFSIEQGYPTPKIDVRAFIVNTNEEILLVKERIDGCWTLPGGWIDVNESPSEAAIRETKEETGYNVKVVSLLALWDKQKHDHPPEWPHAYKCFFYCKIIDGNATENIEISDISFFGINDLPPLSTPRTTKNQIIRLNAIRLENKKTYFD